MVKQKVKTKRKKTKTKTKTRSIAQEQAAAQAKIADVALKQNMMRAMGLSYSPMMTSVPYQTNFNQYNPGQKGVLPRPSGYLNPKGDNTGPKSFMKDGKVIDPTSEDYKQKIGLLPGETDSNARITPYNPDGTNNLVGSGVLI